MTKRNDLILRLLGRWISTPDLCREFGWLPHTLRAAISTEARKHQLTVERHRVDGVTSYRLIDPEYDATKDVSGSFDDAYAAIRERVAAGGPGWEPK